MIKPWQSPYRQYLTIILMVIGFVVELFVQPHSIVVLVFILIGALPTLSSALQSVFKLRVSIDTFNAFAVVISIFVADYFAVMFIILMLAFASLLEWRVESRAQKTVEELLKLKPLKAFREKAGNIEEVNVEEVRRGDVLIVKTGEKVAVDGQVIGGEALINQATITGESVPVRKVAGDTVFSATINESGMIKMRATDVGKDSTIERMAQLIREAAAHKSQPEKLADRFAGIFLPIVIVLGLGTYLVTKSLSEMAAVFLVACADDMAVAIPLAIAASIGQAAKRGILVKGGNRLDLMRKIKTVVLDKTGTLTYGAFHIRKVSLQPGFPEKTFWNLVGSAEKYSEHPIGRAIVHEATRISGELKDPDTFKVVKGLGVQAAIGEDIVSIGDLDIFSHLRMPKAAEKRKRIEEEIGLGTVAVVVVNKTLAGYVVVADEPRAEAKQSLEQLMALGVQHIAMFTGDNKAIAMDIGKKLGITEVHAAMSPQEKLRAIGALEKSGPLAMIGDGVNDSPALALADVGIAMGGTGAAVSVEAADIVVLNDNLLRIPELIGLSKRTANVVWIDMLIWAISNGIGFALVWLGLIGPALAAMYNFLTDFLPLINSTRLFTKSKKH